MLHITLKKGKICKILRSNLRGTKEKASELLQIREGCVQRKTQVMSRAKKSHKPTIEAVLLAP